MTQPLLAVRGVKTFYGNIQALKGIDLDVSEGEIVTLIGANGAGKSTLMMTTFGEPARTRGLDHLRGPRHHPHADPRDRQAAHRAIARGPPHLRAHDAFWRTSRWARRSPTRSISRTTSSASARCFPLSKSGMHQRGGTLSGGEQQMLAIGRR